MLFSSFSRLYSLLGLLLVWHIAAVLLASDLLPSPLSVFVSMWEHLQSGELLYHLAITLVRVAISFVIAMIIGVAFGMLMGSRQIWDRTLDSLIILGLNVPALVTIILCYIWFGLTETAAIFAVAINKIPMVAVAIREGARAIEKEFLEVGQVYRLSRKDIFFKIYLPQLYPYLFGAARNGLALIWKIVLVVELLGRSDGIGFQLGNFFQFFDIRSILAYTFAFAAVIFIIEALIMRPMESRLNRWRQ
ncbi:MAG: ABC-type nitrate/sulfonate/bicarbonate transport system, permease component [uncultured Thiotrichaceae bacterium]|uniref:ABC-type nitrate/sulfonate/bicarbonate transport system, permease component n=1 Tax=uncultured Thiotrichaceae bacterium TaxID=298394 RepID=A0A6S6UCH1_9GAMM|nr:MAG: ABC-type nitrate/sulfonate/bicarbonate transport system, permease component [uncultured Thiotrichaceae bacterium]